MNYNPRVETPYTHEEIAGLAGLTTEQTEALDRGFRSIVSILHFAGDVEREELPWFVEMQSKRFGWDRELMADLASDPNVLARAEHQLYENNPQAGFITLNNPQLR